MSNDNRKWMTDAHRKLGEAEKARYRWLTETSQWHRNGDPEPESVGLSGGTKLVIAVVILVLMQVMWSRSTVDSTVTDELIGLSETQGHKD